MREIKFRAWDDEHKAMVRANLTENESLNFVDSRGFELMQYTGLKDKNGKEIYEGDILTTGKKHRDGYSQSTTYRDGTGVVEFKHSRWSISTPAFSYHADDIPELWLNSKEHEVIGNIYENPELLNKT